MKKAVFILIVALFLPVSAAMSADKGAVDVEDARTTLQKWVEIRRIISKEKRDWTLAREVLNERIDLVQREIKSQREKIKETEANIHEADQKRDSLMEENEQLK